MRLGLIPLISILLSTSVARAADNSTQSGADLITKASDKINIFALQSFEMKANVRVENGGKPLDGSYLLLWNGPDQWKEEISFPGYSEIQVGGKGVVFLKRSTDFMPYRIFQLHSALGYGSQELGERSFFNEAPRMHETIKKVHERKIEEAKAECVEIITPEKHTREVCINQTTGTLIRQGDSELMPIGSKVFPRSMASIEDGKPMAEVQITEFKR